MQICTEKKIEIFSSCGCYVKSNTNLWLDFSLFLLFVFSFFFFFLPQMVFALKLYASQCVKSLKCFKLNLVNNIKLLAFIWHDDDIDYYVHNSDNADNNDVKHWLPFKYFIRNLQHTHTNQITQSAVSQAYMWTCILKQQLQRQSANINQKDSSTPLKLSKTKAKTKVVFVWYPSNTKRMYE